MQKLMRAARLGAAALLACTLLAPGLAQAQASKDTLRIGVSLIPRTLNPILGTTTVDAATSHLFANFLVGANDKNQQVPELAAVVPSRANGGISADGKTITYKLRRNVKWHDGVPFTSADVKFTFDAVMNPKNNVISRHGYDLVDRCETPDPYTVVFHFRVPFAPAVNTIFGESDSPIFIIPKHLLEKYADLNDIPFNGQPIGTGPYKVVKWVRGDHIELEANDDFYLGKPKIKHLTVSFFSDENTMLNQLRTHEIDWFHEATVNVYPQLKAIPGAKAIVTPYNGYVGLMFQNQHAPLSDIRVRRAISLALDRDELTRTLTFGAAKVGTGDLPPALDFYAPALAPITQNVAEANKLLDAASLKRGAGGIRTFNGKPLSLDFVYESASALNRRVAVQVQAQLHDVGLDLKPRALVSTVIYGAAAAGGTLASGTYDIGVYPWVAGLDPDNSSQFACENVAPKGYNQSRYCNPAMDAAQKAALTSFDPAARKKAYGQIERNLVDNVPMVFLLYRVNIQGVTDGLKNVRPNAVEETWNAYEWSF